MTFIVPTHSGPKPVVQYFDELPLIVKAAFIVVMPKVEEIMKTAGRPMTAEKIAKRLRKKGIPSSATTVTLMLHYLSETLPDGPVNAASVTHH